MTIKKYIPLLLLFLVAAAFAQEEEVTFEAKVSKEKLGLNERLRVDFTMNKDGDNFTPPSFNNFRVLMGPGQSISNSWINGKRTFSKTYSYILAPVARGTFTIAQASVEIDGKVYKTIPVKIEVTAAVDRPNEEPTAEDVADENLHLVAEVSNANPYLNEAVSVTYKLYVSPNVSVSNYVPLDNPKYNNFWSQDIEIKRLKVENGVYQGKNYRYVVLKQVVLYPQKTGSLEIEPLSLDVTVDVPTNRRDIFGGRLYTQANKTVSAGARNLNVKPLPENGKPENFSGAVGQFTYEVSASKTELKASESLTATVGVTGKGNLKLFDLPKLELPSSVEVFDPEFSENITTSLAGMQGKVANNYTLVPQYMGKFQLPPTNFSYFDPKSSTYKTLTSEEITINVVEGPANRAVTGTSENYKQPVKATGNAFRFIKLQTRFQPKKQPEFLGSSLFYALLLLPLALIPIIIATIKKKQSLDADLVGNRIKTANRLAKKYLSEAKKALGKKEAFYEALERALHNYLKAKLKIETTEFHKEKIKTLLLSNNVEEENVNAFIGLLNSCELARYAPSSQVAMQNDYEKAADVISKIDKQIKL